MNKKLFLIFIVLLFSSKIYSQIINMYGLKLGYVNSSQTFTNKAIDDIAKRKSGFSISAFVDLFNFNGFSISPEIKYIQKGVGLGTVITGPERP